MLERVHEVSSREKKGKKEGPDRSKHLASGWDKVREMTLNEYNSAKTDAEALLGQSKKN